jgi:microcystin degradation protein MlrC
MPASTDAAAFAIFDPAAVQQMIAAGVGSTVTLSLGGKLDMPGIGLKGSPRTVTGRVKLVCDGRYRNRGPMGRGELNDMGPTAVLAGGRHRDGGDLQPCRAPRHGRA